MVNVRMQPPEVNRLAPKITVVGVGGAGGNAVNNMINSGLEGTDFVVCNTDSQSLHACLAENKIQLGENVTGGLGAGAKPDIGRAAAEESLNEVLASLEGANMVFVTAGMGGGTGTGAAPVIARAARDQGMLTVGVVTKPFHFEGTHRMKMAEKGIEEMQEYVDTLIVIPNQNLFRIANEKTTFAEAFKMADTVLQSGVRGVTDLMVMPGLINLDFADIRSAMQEMGKAMMGTGEAEGERRAIEAAEAAISNPLLDDVSMKGARGVIINITGGYDMTLFEADEACNRIRDEVDPDANIIFGSTFDEGLEGVMRVSVVATGIDVHEAEQPVNRGQTDGGLKVVATQPAQTINQQTLNQKGNAAVQSTQGQATQGQAPQSQSMQGQPMQEGGNAQYSQQNSSMQAERVKPQTVQAKSSFPYIARASANNAAVSSSAASQPVSQPEPQQTVAQTQPQGYQQSGALSQQAVTQQTVPQAQRVGDSFIPPQPLDPSYDQNPGKSFQENTQPVTGDNAGGNVYQKPGNVQASPQRETQNSQTSASLAARQNVRQEPQVAPQPQHEDQMNRSESHKSSALGNFINRLTGGQGHSQRPEESQGSMNAERASSREHGKAQPSQGKLNIDSPAADPHGEYEDELDIPAFLRRQAN